MMRLNLKARDFALRAGGLKIMRRMAPVGVRILLYHRFPAAFRDSLSLQCQYLRRHYSPVSLAEIDGWLQGGAALPPNALAVTVDDGHHDFFQVAYPVFRAYGIPVTVFLTTGFLDRRCWLWTDQMAYLFRHTSVSEAEIALPEGNCRVALGAEADRLSALDTVKRAAKRMPHAVRTALIRTELPRALRLDVPASAPVEYEPLVWDEVRTMSRDGMFFGAHTQTHPILSSIASPVELRHEILESKTRIEQELDLPVPHFSYPNGTSSDIDARTIGEVKAAGFSSAVIAERGVNLRHTDPFLLYRIPVGPTDASASFRPRYFEDLTHTEGCMETGEKLRFGVLCNGTIFREWQARCIEALIAAGARPALLILDARPPLPPKPLAARLGRLLRLKINLFSIYSRYYVNPRARASRPVELSQILAGVPQQRCVVQKRGKFSEYFDPADVAAIRGHQLDFMLRFGFNIIRGEILSAPRYGVWSFHHGDEQRYRGAPPGFWEIFRDDPETGAILQRLTETLDGGVVLKKALLPTVSHSYAANRDAAHYAGIPWPAEVCRDILAGQADYVDAGPVRTTAPIYKEPSNGEMIRFFWKQFGHGLRHRFFANSPRLADLK